MPNESHFEIYPEAGDGDPQYRWRFRSANGVIVAASGDGFSTPSHASDAIHDFLRAVSYVEGAEPHPPIIELDKNGERV